MRPLFIIPFILWTTSRHEASHALMAFLQGAEIQEMRLLPGIHEELGFYFGYVIHNGEAFWLTEAAPFFSDILMVMLTSLILLRSKIRLYNEFILFGIISPLVDLIYNYQGGLWREGTDVADLFVLLPDWIVHGVFVTVIGSSILMLRHLRNNRPDTQNN